MGRWLRGEARHRGPHHRSDADAAGEWRRAVLASDLPRHVRVVASQLAHFAVHDDATVVRPPSMLVLGECAELGHRDVLDAVAVLARAGWTRQVPDPDHPDDRPILGLADPRGGAR